jgi:hypothetical protein
MAPQVQNLLPAGSQAQSASVPAVPLHDHPYLIL